MVDNKPIVLITGGQGDLAKALEKQFSAEGWHVLAPGRDALNVTDSANVSAYFSQLTRLDLLINNAGIIRDRLLAQMSSEEWSSVIDVSLRGSFLCSQAALPLMIRQKSGHILFIASRSAKSGPRGQSNYAAAKAGMIGLCQSLAREHGRDNIRANVIFPGYLPTKMNRHLSADVVDYHRKDNTLERFNTLDSVARFVTVIATLDHTSGQIFTLDSRIDRWT